ncbi:SulP family inorganic anion transporter [Methylocystis sp. MJC1]|jgi:MFS superfamily sulfate permease-like transporter|uniref:SulP family inorganic anion transporter n=1 Tax=Methylocystis sp. MJC1 TaxID=2654282 RepID=UPI0013EBD496|nr:SulP family inorganic anion transporter [Methylocystis sp. MJC1]KAF2990002.1 C4-dicarboxylic acid transporter DauA [Methylocystis sp. MJC1]MBU6528794.1 SulP family inorganic anion transporter [Methylocystis sp. MJC1]UZX11679.1 SulP family inorganic anion transporter [Methylocystis sp. MJC1]
MTISTPAYDTSPPKSGFAGLFESWRSDIISGFLVFLIALPLCLGIAMASGFPPQAGIISAIVGGLLVSRVNGSYVTIMGPAAGLIVVILDSVGELGDGNAMAGYRYTLAAIFFASLLQILMGVMKAGKMSAFFPSSAVHGMLAAIGIIIMAKQIHVMLGVKPDAQTLFQTIGAIPASLRDMNPEVAVIGFLGLGILALWTFVGNPKLKMIPAPLLVVLLGMALGKYFDIEDEHKYLFLPDMVFLPHHEFTIGPKFLVTLPENFLAGFAAPDFALVGHLVFWQQVVTIALVGSLESLLSAAAVDKLDPYKRTSDLNRDIAAVGVGNAICGLIGGLPMIAEIVRSSANVNNGAKTGWANFFHGLFLLVFVALFPKLIHEIPLASLAALLVFTGYRLASPREFKKTLAIGWDQLGVFVITIVGVLATDLLIGVAIGVLAELAFHFWRSIPWADVIKLDRSIEETSPGVYHVQVKGAAFFGNYLALKNDLTSIPPGKKVFFDLSETATVDHTVMENLHHFCEDYHNKGGHAEIRGLDQLVPTSDHPLAPRKRPA